MLVTKATYYANPIPSTVLSSDTLVTYLQTFLKSCSDIWLSHAMGSLRPENCVCETSLSGLYSKTVSLEINTVHADGPPSSVSWYYQVQFKEVGYMLRLLHMRKKPHWLHNVL